MNLVRIAIDKIQNRVISVFKDYPEVVGVYLFGSSLDLCRPESDIDIGVFLLQGLDGRELWRLEGEIGLKLDPLEGHSFDITFINPHNTLFAFQVIKEGVLLYTREQEILTDLIEQISRDYSEKGYRYQLAVAEILEEIRTNA